MATSNTILGPVSLAPRGEYDPAAQYTYLDLVRYNGSGYLVLRSIQGVTPVDGADYMLITERGGIGATGETGPQGEQGIQGVQGEKGETGDPGSSIARIERTAGTGAPGTRDTYTITLTDGSTSSFEVYNGADGIGAGDMTAAVYDPQGKAQDIFKYVDDHTQPDAVTVAGGGEIEMEEGLGEGPYTFEYTPDEEGSAVQASQVGYDSTESGLEAETVQGALDLLSVMVLSGGVPYGKELTESWASLQARIQAGNFKGIRIGDFKTITLTTGEVVIMEVAGIDQYYRCGWPTGIGHHIDFISRDCLADTKVFNDTNTNNGTAAEPNPWRASKLFQTLNDEATGVIATLPSDLKPCIIDKRALLESRFSSAGALESSTGWAWNNMGKLWLPTEVEVFGNTFWSDGDAGWTGGGGCNLQYPIFYGGAKHIIKGAGNGGDRRAWWEATARRQSSTDACGVGSDGNAIGVWATNGTIFAPLCFRIG